MRNDVYRALAWCDDGDDLTARLGGGQHGDFSGALLARPDLSAPSIWLTAGGNAVEPMDERVAFAAEIELQRTSLEQPQRGVQRATRGGVGMFDHAIDAQDETGQGREIEKELGAARSSVDVLAKRGLVCRCFLQRCAGRPAPSAPPRCSISARV
jgi:hypothetical protein